MDCKSSGVVHSASGNVRTLRVVLGDEFNPSETSRNRIHR